MCDVAFDKLALLLPTKIQSDIVSTASDDDEQSEQHGAQTRSEALIVVAGSTPCWEAVIEEVVVACTLWATQDVGDYSETGESGRGFLVEGIELLLGGLSVLRDLNSRLLTRLFGSRLGLGEGRDEALASLVRVNYSALLTVGLVDVVLGGGWLDADE